ncbi:MAG TPA: hypothetical protein ENJ93_07515 [Chloroflexi bacterium]|nr:hypothetical protein [Chloroflexota bacterium]
MYMVMLILHKMDECTPVLDAWEETGVGGITILESSGLGRMRKARDRSSMPLMPSLSDFLKRPEERHRTIFTVVEGEEWVDRLIEATERVIGDLENPDNGVLFVLPVYQAKGLKGGQERAKKR